jgi:hypothetical protein
VRQVSKKTLPLPPPDALMLPASRTTKSTLERGIEEKVIHKNSAEGVQSEDTSPQTGFTVLEVVLVSAFYGFLECLCAGHICSPLCLRASGGAVAHIARVSQDDSVDS